ncbi:MAG TPA: Rrf2 family transcriptional regulator [Fibrobacteria bacterium]|nr:Rrf2 family transcriptional regulator [Fibrobacteria bacterium]
MKVTTKTIYALQLLLALADRGRVSRAPIQLREIAETYNLPFKFLEQIAIALKGAGWIHGQRGKEGGYVLSVPPRQLTLGDVLRLLEGDSSSKSNSHHSPQEDAIDAFLERCKAAMDDVSEHTTLADLLDDAARRRPADLEYQI